MGEQYFAKSPTVAHDVREATVQCAGKALRFQTDAGVFSKGELDKGTALLIGALPEQLDGRALDLGCGWGPVGACMAAKWPRAEVVLSDINGRAVALARGNLSANRIPATVYQSDGLADVPGTFDLIALNPPIRAGKETVYRLYAECAARLNAGGALYIVIRKQQGADSTKRHFEGIFPAVDVIDRSAGYRVLRGSIG